MPRERPARPPSAAVPAAPPAAPASGPPRTPAWPKRLAHLQQQMRALRKSSRAAKEEMHYVVRTCQRGSSPYSSSSESSVMLALRPRAPPRSSSPAHACLRSVGGMQPGRMPRWRSDMPSMMADATQLNLDEPARAAHQSRTGGGRRGAAPGAGGAGAAASSSSAAKPSRALRPRAGLPRLCPSAAALQ